MRSAISGDREEPAYILQIFVVDHLSVDLKAHVSDNEQQNKEI